jgi:hypothetical protein
MLDFSNGGKTALAMLLRNDNVALPEGGTEQEDAQCAAPFRSKKSPDTGKGDTYNRMKPCLIVSIET